MEVCRYEASLHEKEIQIWCDKHGISPKLTDDFPVLGFVACHDDECFAAGFLRRIEGNYALFDGLITNPRGSSLDRHIAIEAVVKRIIKEAKDLGIPGILAYSLDTGTIERAISHGFKIMPHTLIMRDGE